MEKNPAPPSPPASESETAALPEAEELEEVEESWPANAEVHWDEASTDWEGSGGGVGMPGVGDTQSSINGIFSTSTYCKHHQQRHAGARAYGET